jgi:hypothetical protein
MEKSVSIFGNATEPEKQTTWYDLKNGYVIICFAYNYTIVLISL